MCVTFSKGVASMNCVYAALANPDIYEFLESDLCLPSLRPTMTAM
jgi:hypothetical protein